MTGKQSSEAMSKMNYSSGNVLDEDQSYHSSDSKINFTMKLNRKESNARKSQHNKDDQLEQEINEQIQFTQGANKRAQLFNINFNKDLITRNIRNDTSYIDIDQNQKEDLLDQSDFANELNDNQLSPRSHFGAGEKSRKNLVKKQNFFSVLTKAKYFVNRLKENCRATLYKNLKGEHIQIIGDKAYVQYKVKRIIIPFREKIGKFFISAINFIDRNVPLLEPINKFIIFWQIVRILVLTMFVYELPLSYVYQLKKLQAVLVTNIIYIVFFTIDIFINFNLALYKEGIIQRRRQVIAKLYLKRWFIFDMLSLVLASYFRVEDYNVLMIFMFSNIFKLPQIVTDLDNYYQFQQKFPTIYELLQLLFKLFIVAHYCSLGFYKISQLPINMEYSGNNWVIQQNLKDKHWIDQYVNGLYFSFITMITVGYGDITPVTLYEKIYCIFMTLVSCCVFAYVVNSIGQIIRDVQVKSSEFRYGAPGSSSSCSHTCTLAHLHTCTHGLACPACRRGGDFCACMLEVRSQRFGRK